MLTYLSPTSVGLAQSDPEQFYMQYCTSYRPREAQSKAMSVGSAFDAYVKAYLFKNLVQGSPKEVAETYEFEYLFEKQVEPHNRDWARSHGGYVYGMYKDLGSLADLFLDLKRACESTGVQPVFESKIEAEVCGVPLLGKPDLFFRLPPSERWPDGTKIVFDWKVNGYCSKSPVSPVQGFAKIRGGKTSGSAHKNALLCKKAGMTFNVNGFFEDNQKSWATQLAIYSWVLDAIPSEIEKFGQQPPVGSIVIPAAVDQLCCSRFDPDLETKMVDIRVAEHRAIISIKFQQELLQTIKDIWVKVKSGTIVSPERAAVLEEKAAKLKELAGPEGDPFLLQISKKPYYG